MDLMQSFDAILFPADGRPPHVVSLMTSPASFSNPHAPAQTSTARIPHPEVHMEYIAEDPNMRAWHYQFVEALDMMNKKFANPYIIYYPVVSRDGMPFPVNRTVRDMQEEVSRGRRLREDQLWRGNLVAAKFADDHFTQMMDASMADFPILKNFLATHASPNSGGTSSPASVLPTPHHQPHPQQQQQQPHSTHPSPPSLPTAQPPHLPVGLPAAAAARHMQYAGPTGGPPPPHPHPHVYEREPSAAHMHPHMHPHPPALPATIAMPAHHRESKPHPHQHPHQHQHQHQHHQQHHQQQQQHHQQQQPPMEL